MTRSFALRVERGLFDPELFAAWSVPQLLAELREPMRVDIAMLEPMGGQLRNQPLARPELARVAFERALARGRRPSLLALRGESVFRTLHERVVGDVLARIVTPPQRPQLALAISASRARTPLHVDDADVVVLQLRGTRRWRTLRPDDLEVDREALVMRGTERLLEDRPWQTLTPLLDVVLAPGDALSVPAFFPHMVDSMGHDEAAPLLSLSAIFPVITPAHLARALAVSLPAAPAPNWFAPLHLEAGAPPPLCARQLAALLPELERPLVDRMAAAHAGVARTRA